MADKANGILKSVRGGATLVNAVQPAMGGIFVPDRLLQQYGLAEGASVTGEARQGPQGRELASVDSVCGLPPGEFRTRTHFEKLVAIDPDRRFMLGVRGDVAMRAVDLLAPLGMGTRGMIVAPPKAGKTALLEQVAAAIRAGQPDARIVVLLIDERPEELTYFRRTVSAEVFASSSDRPPAEHAALAEFMLAHVRIELECGHDIVVLLDSLTRLVRAFNLRSASGRSLSGGIDAAAFDIPRRFFGLARNIENGGSVTLLATLLVDTGSRMDQVIYEEFKSTGNSEIVLDSRLAQDHIFPAIDVHRTSTRKEERLYDSEESASLALLRRTLAGYSPRDAMLHLLNLIAGSATNAELLKRLRPGGR